MDVTYYGEAFGVLAGMGILIGMGVFSYLIYQWGRLVRLDADEETCISAYYISSIKANAKKNGIDLSKEIAKESLFGSIQKQRSFKRELRRELVDSMFGKEGKKGE